MNGTYHYLSYADTRVTGENINPIPHDPFLFPLSLWIKRLNSTLTDFYPEDGDSQLFQNFACVWESLGSKLGYDTEYSEVFVLFLNFFVKCL